MLLKNNAFVMQQKNPFSWLNTPVTVADLREGPRCPLPPLVRIKRSQKEEKPGGQAKINHPSPLNSTSSDNSDNFLYISVVL